MLPEVLHEPPVAHLFLADTPPYLVPLADLPHPRLHPLLLRRHPPQRRPHDVPAVVLIRVALPPLLPLPLHRRLQERVLADRQRLQHYLDFFPLPLTISPILLFLIFTQLPNTVIVEVALIRETAFIPHERHPPIKVSYLITLY